jgi:DNA polymerase-3 subunit epsilon
MNINAVLGETPFAVVDLETTGIYPGGNDRIIEVAIVRFNANLEIEDEWATLVNPRRDIGRADIHGIRAGDVTAAPTFAEIAADVGSRMHDTVVVGHHLRFDLGFLGAEYERCGIKMPTFPSLCTLKLAYQYLPEAPSRKLGVCCEQVGIDHEEEHVALGDARATGYLLAAFLKDARRRGATTLAALGCDTSVFPDSRWLGTLSPSGKRMTRAGATSRQVAERSYLARLVAGMVGDEARNAQEAEYLALVDRALEDRRVTQEEAANLITMATSWGMTRGTVLNAHRAYLTSLVSEAMADGNVTDAERQDLVDVCDLLGLHRSAFDVLLSGNAAPPVLSASSTPATVSGLRGKSVCFTGELLGSLHGERISREMAEQLATDAGLDVRPSVTKKLDLLVVADPETQSIKARKARQYGVRIMAEAALWRALGVRVE